MPAIAEAVFQLIDRLHAAPTVSDAWSKYLTAARLAGYDHGLAFLAADETALNERLLLSEMPSGWTQAYSAAQCEHIDPIAERTRFSTAPFSWQLKDWDQVASLRRWHDLDYQAGLHGGIIIPDRSGNKLRAVGLCGGTDLGNVHPHDRMALHFAALELMQRKDVMTLRTRGAGEENKHLSDRERECLVWIAAGKTDWEIGQILSISEKTVNTHIERAKHKLNVTTRPQAIVAAMRLKLIEV